MFRSTPPPLDRIILKSIRTLKTQHFKLDQVNARLKKRDQTLFKACTFAIKKKNSARASVCANELAEVRKLLKLLSQTQIAIERIILRLETIKELSNMMIDLKPALRSLKDITANLSNVMPEIAYELENVNSSIQDTLNIARLSSEPPIIHSNIKTPGGQEVLKEVTAVLEEKVAEKLPPPPISHITNATQIKEEIREAVALAAGIPDSCEIPEKTPRETLLSIKDLRMQNISLRIQDDEAQSLEDQILDYVNQCKGHIDITQCALKLKIPPNEIRKTLENLDEKGKIIMRA